jgi:hypothetical protein
VEEGAGAPPEVTLRHEDDSLGADEDDFPEAEASMAAIKRGPSRRCMGGKGSR